MCSKTKLPGNKAWNFKPIWGHQKEKDLVQGADGSRGIFTSQLHQEALFNVLSHLGPMYL
jgi:hypothetical protein